MLTARATGQSARFLGREKHQRKRDDEAHDVPQDLGPASISHPHHPLSQGSG